MTETRMAQRNVGCQGTEYVISLWKPLIVSEVSFDGPEAGFWSDHMLADAKKSPFHLMALSVRTIW
jgi:hypothetical protein